MDELARAKQQYFRLMRLVNKGRELSFVASDDKLFAVIGTNQRVLLCEYKERDWVSVQITEFWELEEFLETFMNNQKTIDDKLTEKIRLALFGHSS